MCHATLISAAFLVDILLKHFPCQTVVRIEGLPDSTALSTLDNALAPAQQRPLQTMLGGSHNVHAFLLKLHKDFIVQSVRAKFFISSYSQYYDDYCL